MFKRLFISQGIPRPRIAFLSTSKRDIPLHIRTRTKIRGKLAEELQPCLKILDGNSIPSRGRVFVLEMMNNWKIGQIRQSRQPQTQENKSREEHNINLNCHSYEYHQIQDIHNFLEEYYLLWAASLCNVEMVTICRRRQTEQHNNDKPQSTAPRFKQGNHNFLEEVNQSTVEVNKPSQVKLELQTTELTCNYHISPHHISYMMTTPCLAHGIPQAKYVLMNTNSSINPGHIHCLTIPNILQTLSAVR